MSKLEVRIVEMGPMRVACAHGFGASPEAQATEKMMAFLARHGLEFDDVRWFGFDNPGPSPGSPNYGYDVWVPVSPNIDGDDGVQILDFEGGLYAVTRFKGLSHIGDTWQRLVHWREDSSYEKGCHQWLENLLTDPRTPSDEFVLDLDWTGVWKGCNQWDPKTPSDEFVFDLYLPIAE